MIVGKLHKRSIVRVLEPDIPERTVFCIQDARVNAMLAMHQLLKDEDIRPGDELTVDIRVLIDRK